MDRRTFTVVGALLLGAASTRPAGAASAVRRVGMLTFAAGYSDTPGGVLRQALREHGFVEGRDVEFVWKTAAGVPERLPAVAAELAAQRVDVIVTFASEATHAARRVTTAIPIVFIGPSYPVEEGLVASFARPGGNVTGVTLAQSDHVSKQLQLLQEAMPRLADVALVWSPANPGNALAARDMEAVARGMHLRVHRLPMDNVTGIDETLAAIARLKPSALVVIPTPLIMAHGRRFAEHAVKLGMPSTSALKRLAEHGLLFSYGADFFDLERKAAGFVARILKGAPPGDLPVEAPTRYDLVVNMKTARALAIPIPQSILLRADHVID